MLSQKNRAGKEALIRILKQGKSFFSNNISLKITHTNNEQSVFAFIVPTKTAKRATERNKIKRRARHIVKNMIRSIKNGLGVAVFFKKGIQNKNFYETKEEIRLLFEKAGILSDKN